MARGAPDPAAMLSRLAQVQARAARRSYSSASARASASAALRAANVSERPRLDKAVFAVRAPAPGQAGGGSAGSMGSMEVRKISELAPDVWGDGSVGAVPCAPNEVVIQAEVVASNPKDWKSAALWTGIEGSDVGGYVLRVGADVRGLKVGDRVVAFTPIRLGSQYGSYQAYVACPWWTVARVPSSLPLARAVALPLAGLTAAMGLYHARKLRLPEPRRAPKSGGGRAEMESARAPKIIWGAGSAVGAYALQLERQAASSRNTPSGPLLAVAGAGCARAHALGADAVFDYREGADAVVARVARWLAEAGADRQAAADAGGSGALPRMRAAFDAASSEESVGALARILHAERQRQRGEAGQPEGDDDADPATITTLLPTPQEARLRAVRKGREARAALPAHLGGREDLSSALAAAFAPEKAALLRAAIKGAEAAAVLPRELRGTRIVRTQVGAAHGAPRTAGSARGGGEDDAAFANRWLRQLVNWAAEGRIEPTPTRVVPGGLDGVVQGLELLRQGKVHGEKLVYRIDETNADT